MGSCEFRTVGGCEVIEFVEVNSAASDYVWRLNSEKVKSNKKHLHFSVEAWKGKLNWGKWIRDNSNSGTHLSVAARICWLMHENMRSPRKLVSSIKLNHRSHTHTHTRVLVQYLLADDALSLEVTLEWYLADELNSKFREIASAIRRVKNMDWKSQKSNVWTSIARHLFDRNCSQELKRMQWPHRRHLFVQKVESNLSCGESRHPFSVHAVSL